MLSRSDVDVDSSRDSESFLTPTSFDPNSQYDFD